DSGNNRVCQVSGGALTTIPAGALNTPTGVAVDSFGSLYIADRGNRRVLVWSNGVVQTAAGTGSDSTVTALLSARDVAADAKNAVYIADGRRVRRLAPDGTASTVAGDG